MSRAARANLPRAEDGVVILGDVPEILKFCETVLVPGLLATTPINNMLCKDEGPSSQLSFLESPPTVVPHGGVQRVMELRLAGGESQISKHLCRSVLRSFLFS